MSSGWGLNMRSALQSMKCFRRTCRAGKSCMQSGYRDKDYLRLHRRDFFLCTISLFEGALWPQLSFTARPVLS